MRTECIAGEGIRHGDDTIEAEQRRAIWHQYRTLYDIGPAEPIPADDRWTRAEIKSCCRLSALLDASLTEAAHNVVPVSITSAEAIEQLCDWASGHCLSTDRPGISEKPVSNTVRRKIDKPSTNCRESIGQVAGGRASDTTRCKSRSVVRLHDGFFPLPEYLTS